MRVLLSTNVLKDPLQRADSLLRLSKRRADRAAAGRGFDFPTQLVGAGAHGRVNVYYDPALGEPGLTIAKTILPKLDSLFADNDAIFGVTGKAGNIIIAALDGKEDGGAGAYHYGCGFNDETAGASDWYEDVAVGNPGLTFGLVQAEVSESYMGLQRKGWDCGGSNGEALSRVLAEQVSGGANGSLKAYATGPAWAQAGFPNWIDVNDSTDRDAASTGCGVVYLYWMLSQGFTLTQIAQAGCPDGTLAGNYRALTSKSAAWADFLSAVHGLTGAIKSDNPWSSGTRIPHRDGVLH